MATSDIVISLPNLKQLETGEFDLDELVKTLTEALADDSQRNETLQLTGDTAVLIIECLDKVSQIGSGLWTASPDHPLGHLVRPVQSHSGRSTMFKSVLHIFKTISKLSISPSFL